MPPSLHKSRIHLLAAVEAPTLVIIQRKRAKLFHIVVVDTRTHVVTQGSWFRGVLYAQSCDVSFDGRFLVYRARGSDGRSMWSGIARLPYLRALVDVRTIIGGGGYFADRNVLETLGWEFGEKRSHEDVPFKLRRAAVDDSNPELSVFYGRLARDGFTRLGDNWGSEKRLRGPGYQIACVGDDGWGHRYSPRHPELRIRYLGFLESAFRFAFSLDADPALLEGASCATWDSDGNLWAARPGRVEMLSLADLRSGRSSFSLDVDAFEPPARERRA